MEHAIRGADVIMMLRVQLERQNEAAFPDAEYFSFYGLRLEHVEAAKPNVIVMHPGPLIAAVKSLPKWPIRSVPLF